MEFVIQLFGPTMATRSLGAFLVLWVATVIAAGIASISACFLPLVTYAVIQAIIELRVRLNRPRASFERKGLFYKLQSIPAKKLEDTRPMQAREFLHLQRVPGGLDAVADTVGRRFSHAFSRCETSDEQAAFLTFARKFLMDEVWRGGDASPRTAVGERPRSAPAEGKPIAAVRSQAKGANKVSKKKQVKGPGTKKT